MSLLERAADGLEQTYANAFVGFAASPPGLAACLSLVLFFLLVPLIAFSRLIRLASRSTLPCAPPPAARRGCRSAGCRTLDRCLCTCRLCRRTCAA